MKLPQAFAAVGRLAHDGAAPLEEGADEAANVAVVVDHEDPGLVHTSFIPRPSAVPSKEAEG
jgi:hypothetical protein